MLLAMWYCREECFPSVVESGSITDTGFKVTVPQEHPFKQKFKQWEVCTTPGLYQMDPEHYVEVNKNLCCLKTRQVDTTIGLSLVIYQMEQI